MNKDIPSIVGALREMLGLEMRDPASLRGREKRDAKYEQEYLEKRAQEFQSVDEVKKFFRPDYGVERRNAAVKTAQESSDKAGKTADILNKKFVFENKDYETLEEILVKKETDPELAEENKNLLDQWRRETDPEKKDTLEKLIQTNVRVGSNTLAAQTTKTNADVKLASRVGEAEDARVKEEDKRTKRSQEELKKMGKFKEEKEEERTEKIGNIVDAVGNALEGMKDMGRSIQQGRNLRRSHRAE